MVLELCERSLLQKINCFNFGSINAQKNKCAQFMLIIYALICQVKANCRRLTGIQSNILQVIEWHESLIFYSRFSHDVTKIQTKKLSLLLFYFHVILMHLKTFVQTNFRLKGLFVLPYRTIKFPGFCLTRHLAGGRESSCVG